MLTGPGNPRRSKMSAAPRWSHRDPVEGGNPFPVSDPRRARWEEATACARAALQRYDDELTGYAPVIYDPETYAHRWLDLATMRFDTWARRGLAAVDNTAAHRDYAAWLQIYVANWRGYVAETCPHVTADVRAELDSRLQTRAEHWVDEARFLLGNGCGNRHTSRRLRTGPAPAEPR